MVRAVGCTWRFRSRKTDDWSIPIAFATALSSAPTFSMNFASSMAGNVHRYKKPVKGPCAANAAVQELPLMSRYDDQIAFPEGHPFLCEWCEGYGGRSVDWGPVWNYDEQCGRCHGSGYDEMRECYECGKPCFEAEPYLWHLCVTATCQRADGTERPLCSGCAVDPDLHAAGCLSVSLSPKFTPGPWELETVPTAIGIAHHVRTVRLCIYADGLHQQRNPDPEPLANAQLAAAAPELYAALKNMLDTHGAHGPCTGNGCKTCRWAYDKARAALAKARGEQ